MLCEQLRLITGLRDMQRSAPVEACTHGVQRPEGLHADVVAHRIVAGAADEDRRPRLGHQSCRHDVEVIGRGVVGMVAHGARGIHGGDLRSGDPAGQIEVVHEHVAEGAAAAGDEFGCAGSNVVCGQSQRVEHSETTGVEGHLDAADAGIETPLESDLHVVRDRHESVALFEGHRERLLDQQRRAPIRECSNELGVGVGRSRHGVAIRLRPLPPRDRRATDPSRQLGRPGGVAVGDDDLIDAPVGGQILRADDPHPAGPQHHDPHALISSGSALPSGGECATIPLGIGTFQSSRREEPRRALR